MEGDDELLPLVPRHLAEANMLPNNYEITIFEVLKKEKEAKDRASRPDKTELEKQTLKRCDYSLA